jgi:hypothetical protein
MSDTTAGIPAEWLKPRRRYSTGLGDTDERLKPDMMGMHRGRFTNLNILNAADDYVYWHELKDPKSDYASVTEKLIEGWEIVDPNKGHRERLATPAQAGDLPFGRDQSSQPRDGGLSATHELILMRIHKDALRDVAERKAAANKAQLQHTGRDFQARGEQLAHQVGDSAGANRGPLYFARGDHGYADE